MTEEQIENAQAPAAETAEEKTEAVEETTEAEPAAEAETPATE